MLSFAGKISILENHLLQINDTYADSSKVDIVLFLGEFVTQNSNLNVLNKLSSNIEIENWVAQLTLNIVLKFNEDEEQLSDFIFYVFNHSFPITVKILFLRGKTKRGSNTSRKVKYLY